MAAAPGDALQHSPLLAMVMDWAAAVFRGGCGGPKKMLAVSSITTSGVQILRDFFGMPHLSCLSLSLGCFLSGILLS